MVLFEPLSIVAEKYVHKGSKVLITGKIKTRSYESGGVKKYITEIHGNTLELMGEKPQAAQTPVVESSGMPMSDNQTDDLPF